MLRNSSDRTVSVELKYKNGKLKDFRILTESLAKVYNDERFLQLEWLGGGLNDKSCRDI